MRIKNSIKNAKFSLIFTIITMILNFISRSLFIKILGQNITGFNTLINSLMGFLNIAELGISVAITYHLYKPLREKEYIKISNIMSLFKYYYNNVAKVIFILGIIVSMFLKFFIKEQVNIVEGYLYFYMFLVNTLIMYSYSYKQTLVTADQKNYIIVTINSSIRIIKIMTQVISIIKLKNYFVFILIEILSTVVNMFLTNRLVERKYPMVNFKIQNNIKTLKENNYDIIKSIKNIFFHKIGSFIVYQTDGIMISLFFTLKQTAIYGNYMMIINGILSLSGSITTSLTASIGNLVSEQNDNKSYEVFTNLYTLHHIFAVIITYCLYKLINLFTILWLGENFLFDNLTVMVLLINVYIQIVRCSIDKFKESYGIFGDIYAPIIEGSINLIISYLLINRIGIVGLFIGTVISNIIIIIIWKPYLIYRYGFKINIFDYYYMLIKFIILSNLSIILANISVAFFENLNLINTELFPGFIIYSALILITIITSSIAVYSINRGFRDTIIRIYKSL